MRSRVPLPRSRPLQALCADLVLRPPGPALAFGVRSLADSLAELVFRPFERRDAVDELGGLLAPPDWEAFGVVAHASAWQLDTSGPPEPVTLAVVASRGGAVAHAISGRPAGGAEQGDGRLLDACRRVLGLATAPPDQDPAWWSVLDWVDRVLAVALVADTPAWPTVMRLDRGGSPAYGSWSAIRAGCAAGRIVVPGIAAPAAAWMDDGMFSREALSGYPPLGDALSDLAALLPAITFDQLVDAIAARLSASRAWHTTR